MIPALTLPVLPWLRDPALQAIWAAFDAGQALLVGGAVRAAVLGEVPTDVDIATTLTPDAVTARLEGAGIKVVPTGIAHGTVTAVAGGRGFEITTLRRDVETDGRRAVVAFTTDWGEDAQRRDFTMNTLLMDLNGRVYDPTGQGIADLRAGVVRFVGDPATRIAEDSLRILRFFRFHARYGKGEPDAAGLSACAAAAGLIANLSRERVTSEVERLLLEPQAGAAIATMISHDILPDLFRPDFNKDVYGRLRGFVQEQASFLNVFTVFAYSVWQNEFDKIEKTVEKYLVLSNAKNAFLKSLYMAVCQFPETNEKLLYRYGSDVALSASIIYHFNNTLDENDGGFLSALIALRDTPVPVLPVGAGDVMAALGLSQGPKVGAVLKKVEAWWLDNNTRPDRTACLDYVKILPDV